MIDTLYKDEPEKHGEGQVKLIRVKHKITQEQEVNWKRGAVSISK